MRIYLYTNPKNLETIESVLKNSAMSEIYETIYVFMNGVRGGVMFSITHDEYCMLNDIDKIKITIT